MSIFLYSSLSPWSVPPPVWSLLCGTVRLLFIHPSWVDNLTWCFLRGKGWTLFQSFIPRAGFGSSMFHCVSFQESSHNLRAPKCQHLGVSPACSLQSPYLFLYLLFLGHVFPLLFFLHFQNVCF